MRIGANKLALDTPALWVDLNSVNRPGIAGSAGS